MCKFFQIFPPKVLVYIGNIFVNTFLIILWNFNKLIKVCEQVILITKYFVVNKRERKITSTPLSCLLPLLCLLKSCHEIP